MKPYYDEDGITIYHGDCRDVLPNITADVAITDPPYNVGINYGEANHDQRADYEEWCWSWFNFLPQVRAISPGIANVAVWCRIAEPPFWIVAWHKPAAMGRGPMGFNNWEPVLIWGKPRGSILVDVVLAPIVPDTSLNGHPAPKPLAWAAGLVTRLVAPGDVVVDPFVGSGTTLVAAAQAGHRAIGIEIEERYCEIAVQRLAQGVLQFEND